MQHHDVRRAAREVFFAMLRSAASGTHRSALLASLEKL